MKNSGFESTGRDGILVSVIVFVLLIGAAILAVSICSKYSDTPNYDTIAPVQK